MLRLPIASAPSWLPAAALFAASLLALAAYARGTMEPSASVPAGEGSAEPALLVAPEADPGGSERALPAIREQARPNAPTPDGSAVEPASDPAPPMPVPASSTAAPSGISSPTSTSAAPGVGPARWSEPADVIVPTSGSALERAPLVKKPWLR